MSSPKRVQPKAAKTIINDAAFAEILEVLNLSIHELVFAIKHSEDDQIEEAQNCLTTVGMNVDRIQELIASAEQSN